MKRTILTGLIVALSACTGHASTTAPSTTTTLPAAPVTISPITSPTTVAAAGPGDSISDPIPLGQSAVVDGWRVEVLGLRKADPADLLVYDPPQGIAYVLVKYQLTRVGDRPAALYDLSPDLVGKSREGRNITSPPMCIGRGINNDTIYPGGTGTTEYCVSVPEGDLATLVASFGRSGAPTWFAVR